MHNPNPVDPQLSLLLLPAAGLSPTARAALVAHPALLHATLAADLADLRLRLRAAPATPVLLVHGTDSTETLSAIATLISTAPPAASCC